MGYTVIEIKLLFLIVKITSFAQRLLALNLLLLDKVSYVYKTNTLTHYYDIQQTFLTSFKRNNWIGQVNSSEGFLEVSNY